MLHFWFAVVDRQSEVYSWVMLEVSIHGAVDPDLLQIRVRCVQIPINVLAFLSGNFMNLKYTH